MNSVTQSHYCVEEITKILNIKSYLLRFWESEFEELGPLISDDGNRIYTPRDLSILKKIKYLLMTEKQSLYKAKALISQEFDLFGTSSNTEIISEQTQEHSFEENIIELETYPEEDKFETVNLSANQEPETTPSLSEQPKQKVERPILKEVEPEISTQTRLEIIKQNNAALTEAQQHKVKTGSENKKQLELLSKAAELLTHTKKSIHLFKLKLEVI